MYYNQRGQGVRGSRGKQIFKFLNPRILEPSVNAGFTLLEIMIALAIVSTAVIAIFNTVNYHADIAYEHTLSTRMFLLAKEKISEMEINPVNQKGAFPDSDFSYEATVQPAKGFVNGEDGGILELKVIIKGHGKEIELSQLVTKTQH